MLKMVTVYIWQEKIPAENLESEYKIKTKVFKFDALEFYNHKNFYNSLDPKPVGVICAVDYLGDQYESEEDFLETKKIIDINFTGCVSILNVIANDFEARKDGFIIGISSITGDRGRRSNYTYGSAKAGLTTYLSGLRSRLIESDVYVTTVKIGEVMSKAANNGDTIAPAKPQEIAYDVFKAQQKYRDIIYSKWQWKFISIYFNNIPEMFFKRMGT